MKQAKSVGAQSGVPSRAAAHAGSAGTGSASEAASPRQEAQQQQIAQLKAGAAGPQAGSQQLPLQLQAGIESLSGMGMDHVKVHYNSDKPATVGALAYTQGHDIHVAPGQEKHLPHEAWHVVQQARQAVPATTSHGGQPVNADASLETEADQMGARAMQMKAGPGAQESAHDAACACGSCAPSLQLKAESGARANDAGGYGGAVMQLKCETCGSSKHKTARCPQTPQQREQHKEASKAFNATKREQLERLKKAEKSGKGSGGTKAFVDKHVKSKGETLGNSATKVANTRKWGGGREVGRSTVVDMSPQDVQKEVRFQVEGLKMNEAQVGEHGLVPNMGVNKPTKFNYRSVSSSVTEGAQGGRAVSHDDEDLSKPVLGLRGEQVHHLHGVNHEDSES